MKLSVGTFTCCRTKSSSERPNVNFKLHILTFVVIFLANNKTRISSCRLYRRTQTKKLWFLLSLLQQFVCRRVEHSTLLSSYILRELFGAQQTPVHETKHQFNVDCEYFSYLIRSSTNRYEGSTDYFKSSVDIRRVAETNSWSRSSHYLKIEEKNCNKREEKKIESEYVRRWFGWFV